MDAKQLKQPSQRAVSAQKTRESLGGDSREKFPKIEVCQKKISGREIPKAMGSPGETSGGSGEDSQNAGITKGNFRGGVSVRAGWHRLHIRQQLAPVRA